MKGIIIYKGKYGATQQYAAWLGEALGLEIFRADEINGHALKRYDFFILGASVYIGKLQLAKWLNRNAALLEGKQVFLFQVAGTPLGENAKREAYNEASVPESVLANCQSFFLPGKMIIEQLSWKDRWLLKMGARLSKEPGEKNNMLRNYDAVHRENIASLTTAVKQFLQGAAAKTPAMQER